MSITATQSHQITESILKMNEMLKNMIDTGMSLQERLMKANVSAETSEITGMGNNIDITA